MWGHTHRRRVLAADRVHEPSQAEVIDGGARQRGGVRPSRRRLPLAAAGSHVISQQVRAAVVGREAGRAVAVDQQRAGGLRCFVSMVALGTAARPGHVVAAYIRTYTHLTTVIIIIIYGDWQTHHGCH